MLELIKTWKMKYMDNYINKKLYYYLLRLDHIFQILGQDYICFVTKKLIIKLFNLIIITINWLKTKKRFLIYQKKIGILKT